MPQSIPLLASMKVISFSFFFVLRNNWQFTAHFMSLQITINIRLISTITFQSRCNATLCTQMRFQTIFPFILSLTISARPWLFNIIHMRHLQVIWIRFNFVNEIQNLRLGIGGISCYYSTIHRLHSTVTIYQWFKSKRCNFYFTIYVISKRFLNFGYWNTRRTCEEYIRWKLVGIVGNLN